MTLVCEDANSKLVDVVTVVDVDAEVRSIFDADGLVEILKIKHGPYSEARSRFRNLSLFES